MRSFAKQIFYAALTILLFAAAIHAGDSGRIIWKPVSDAQLKLNGHGVVSWNVYRAEKKKNLILIQLGHRWMCIDSAAKSVYELSATEVKSQKENKETDEIPPAGRRIPASDWVDRDVGPAQLVRVRLGDYGNTVEVQLPHPLDLRIAY
ncbi:MAG: hypothetical protein ACRD50_16180 [Candidatus Acidiferrales bacterium]